MCQDPKVRMSLESWKEWEGQHDCPESNPSYFNYYLTCTGLVSSSVRQYLTRGAVGNLMLLCQMFIPSGIMYQVLVT
jgi:hypothetical protein